MAEHYQLKCRECGKLWGNEARSFCDECLSPLEVTYDLEAIRPLFTRKNIEAGPTNIWRYSDLLPLPEGYQGTLPTGFTPLVHARRLGKQLGVTKLYVKNDAVCFPTLSFKDRVVATALAAARRFGFQVVSCSSTGNLANAVAAQAAREGFDAWIFIPSDLEPAKVTGTQVFGAKLVRIAGNYDQVNRLCSQIAEKFRWGFVNVNLRPYYAEGSKTVGYEIAEQLGWNLPDNIVVPMAGGSLITKIRKSFGELIALGLVECGIAAWVLSGHKMRQAAIVQTVLLVAMNAGGLIWAWRLIPDPPGMILQNFAFLMLIWVSTEDRLHDAHA